MSDRQTQKINAIETITYAVVLIMILIGLVLAMIDVELFEESYAVEDGLIEWLTVAGFLAGGLVCLRRVLVLRGRRSPVFLALTALLGLAFIFVAGEEISWGQRLFDFQTSEWFREYNAQEETNLHNIRIGGVKLNKLIFSKGIAVVMVLYFAVLAPVYGTRPAFAQRVDALGIPIPKLHHTIACVVMLILTQVLVPSTNRGELAEFGGAFLFLMIVAYPSNSLAFDPRHDV